MAGRLTTAWPLHLDELLDTLRQDGFRIGIGETLRLHQLLVALAERDAPLNDPQRLATLLGPVLCRSAFEQEAFRGHLERWWEGVEALGLWAEVAEREAAPGDATERSEAQARVARVAENGPAGATGIGAATATKAAEAGSSGPPPPPNPGTRAANPLPPRAAALREALE
ncbi:MAG: hypothetical protein ACK59A_14440, partial [Cyanobacteriota bacterium]